MRILQLNAWTGRIKGGLVDYFTENKFDVICLQEAIWADGRDDVLEDFFVTVDQIKEAAGMEYEFRTINWKIDAFLSKKMYQGLAILTNEKIVDAKEVEVFPGAYDAKTSQDLKDHKYMVQRVTLESGLNVLNYHGYWLRDPLGNEDTVQAMKNVVPLIKECVGPFVMCGDLNIVHAAPAMRELDFLHDLTEEYGIDTTLSGLKVKHNVACDHILVNDEIKVVDFRVEDRIVSDHKGLIAEIE